MAKLAHTNTWTAGLWWIRDPKGGRTHLCSVGRSQDYTNGRAYWYASGIWPLGPTYWTELDRTFLACPCEQPERD